MPRTENHNFTDTLLSIDSILDFSDIDEKEYLYDFEPAPLLAVHENCEIYFPGKGIYANDYLSTYKGNFLPHWELESTIYHVSFRLADSVPATTQRKWQEERYKLLGKFAKKQIPLTDDEKRRLQKLYSETIEKYLVPFDALAARLSGPKASESGNVSRCARVGVVNDGLSTVVARCGYFDWPSSPTNEPPLGGRWNSGGGARAPSGRAEPSCKAEITSIEPRSGGRQKKHGGNLPSTASRFHCNILRCKVVPLTPSAFALRAPA